MTVDLKLVGGPDRGHAPRPPVQIARAVWKDARRLAGAAHLRRAVIGYGTLLVALLAIGLRMTPPTLILAMCALTVLLFPVTEYLIHRKLFHSLAFLGNRLAARFWIRVHYAHHQDPNRQDVILASPATVLLFALALSSPILIVSPTHVFAWIFALGLPYLMYEIVHFATHLPRPLASRYLRRRQQLHKLHHFHNETVNFGICWSIIDRIVGTLVEMPGATGRSATVRNLGYDGALADAKPVVREEYARLYGDGGNR